MPVNLLAEENMSEALASGCTDREMRSEGSNAAGLGEQCGFGLAAAPTFAAMALLTAVSGGDQPDVLCSPAPDAFPLSGMVFMYLLMSMFHLPPWLRLVSSRRGGGRS